MEYLRRLVYSAGTIIILLGIFLMVSSHENVGKLDSVVPQNNIEKILLECHSRNELANEVKSIAMIVLGILFLVLTYWS